jgi:hypothetical protein
MTVRLHLRAEVKNKLGKRVLVIRANELYNKFLTRVRRQAANKHITEGTMVITAQEWEKGESKTFDL